MIFNRIGKSIISLVFVLCLVLSNIVSVHAATEEKTIEAIFGPKTSSVNIDPVISEAYIRFSERLEEKGIFTMVCYEDFESLYQEKTSLSLNEYTESMIESEIQRTAQEKNQVEYTDKSYEKAAEERRQGRLTEAQLVLLEEYERFTDYIGQTEYNIGIDYDEFTKLYQRSEFADPIEYTNAQIGQVDRLITTTQGRWYDNIGNSDSNINLSQNPDYSTYNLLSVATKGDIVQETDGGIAYYLGHIAIVQGKYWSSQYQKYYIRLIESNLSGVVYGVLDDDRYDYRGIHIYRVTQASYPKIVSMVAFCESQLSKPYNFYAYAEFLEAGQQGRLPEQCQTSISSSSWYCSEMVWAACYYSSSSITSINLYGSGIPYNMLLPAVLAGSSGLTYKTVSPL